MLIQLHLNPADARAIKAYRLQVKERLYRFNYVSMGNHMALDDKTHWSVFTGDACSARGKGAPGEARRDISERSRRLSENPGDGPVIGAPGFVHLLTDNDVNGMPFFSVG